MEVTYKQSNKDQLTLKKNLMLGLQMGQRSQSLSNQGRAPLDPSSCNRKMYLDGHKLDKLASLEPYANQISYGNNLMHRGASSSTNASRTVNTSHSVVRKKLKLTSKPLNTDYNEYENHRSVEKRKREQDNRS